MEPSFRDHLATVDDQGNRKWIYPKKPSGSYYQARIWLSYLLLAFLFLAPWIQINGLPLMMFNVLERKFILFGVLFYPHDFHIFMFSMVTGIIGIGIFTLVFGRIFCGWVCPQTIFMEMLFRRIEYWIEGDWIAQRKLDQAPDSPQKTAKKILKHSIFFALSFLIANTFLAYLIGSPALLAIVTDSPLNHLGGLAAITIFSLVFYLVFSHLREQVCTTVCPYGRLQSVLLDKHSIVIAYDHVRGEAEQGRAKYKAKQDRQALGLGDCVDCRQCVHVCPTGIDIRNGTQLECINCTACIDACDGIMDKLGMEKGLIRYTSEHKIQNPQDKRWFVPRNWLFIALMLVLTAVLGLLFSFRTSVELTLLRTSGQLYQEPVQGRISNLYNYALINKTNEDKVLYFALLSDFEQAEIKIIGMDSLRLPAQGHVKGTLFLTLNQADLNPKGSTKVEFGLFDQMGNRVDAQVISFLGPR